MPSYLYTSPPTPGYGTDEYDAPRTPRGRRRAISPPRAGASPEFATAPSLPRMTGYGDTFDSYNDGAPAMPRMGASSPAQEPQLPSSTILRRQNMGTLPRGPSPQFASSELGQQRFPGLAPQHPRMPNYGPAQFPVGAPQPPAAQPATPQYTPTQLKQIKAYRDRLKGELDGEIDPDALSAKKAEISKYDEILAPKPSFLDSTAQPQGKGALDSTRAVVGAEQPMRERVDTSTPEYQQRVTEMYATAARDLDRNPNLGTKPIPAAPQQELTYSNTAAARAVEMGPDQARKNEAAIRGGEERRYNAATGEQTAQNIAQMDQNQMAAANIGARGEQFARGDYDLSKPAGSGGQPAVAGVQQGQQLSVDQARQFLQLAGGDRAKAEALARQAGYSF